MKPSGFCIAAAALLSAAGAAGAPAPRHDDPQLCARSLAGGPALSGDAHRRCVIAIAGAYLDAEVNPTLAAKLPLAEDVSRRVLGRPPVHGPGGRARVLAALDQSIVASIRNRRWSVEGDVAWVIYDAALRTNPKPTPYPLGERIVVRKGLIDDILILAPSGVQ